MQARNWLSVSELDQMLVGVANDCEVADAAAGICRRNIKDSESSGLFSHLVDLLARLTLKAEMVHS